jgi:hypothetical protein
MIKIGEAPARGAIVTTGFVVVADVGLSRIPMRSARLIAGWSIHA